MPIAVDLVNAESAADRGSVSCAEVPKNAHIAVGPRIAPPAKARDPMNATTAKEPESASDAKVQQSATTAMATVTAQNVKVRDTAHSVVEPEPDIHWTYQVYPKNSMNFQIGSN